MSLDIATLGVAVNPAGAVAGSKVARTAILSMGTAARTTATRIRSMGKSLMGMKTLIAGLGIGLVGKNIVGVGMDFERTMGRVKGVTRATGAEFKALKDIARKLGETTEFKATEAAGGLQFLAMAGFTAKDAISALPGVLDLATASGVDLARSADIASNALTAMRLPVDELTRVNDVFSRTITTSNTNMEQLAEAFRYSAPLAAGLGFEIEELSAYIGILGNSGIQGSMAGTQLAFAMQKLDKAFTMIGSSVSNAEGDLKGIADFMEEFEEQQYSTEKATRILMKAFGQRGGKGMLALMSQGSEAVREYIGVTKAASGATKELADIIRSDTKAALDELKSVIESVKIDAFEQDAGVLKSTIKELTTAIRENKDELIALAAGMAATVKWAVILGSHITDMTGRVMKWKALRDEGRISTMEWIFGEKSYAEALIAYYEKLDKKIADSAAKAQTLKEQFFAIEHPLIEEDKGQDEGGAFLNKQYTMPQKDIDFTSGESYDLAAGIDDKEQDEGGAFIEWQATTEMGEKLRTFQDEQAERDRIYSNNAIALAKNKAKEVEASLLMEISAYEKLEKGKQDLLKGALGFAAVALGKEQELEQASAVYNFGGALMKALNTPYPANIAAYATVFGMGTKVLQAFGGGDAGQSAGSGGSYQGSRDYGSTTDTTAPRAITVHADFSSLDLDDANREILLEQFGEMMGEILGSANGDLDIVNVDLG